MQLGTDSSEFHLDTVDVQNTVLVADESEIDNVGKRPAIAK